MHRAEFVFFDAGGGHRAAATALKQILEEQQQPWEVTLLNLRDVLEPLDIIRRLTGVALQDVYNRMLASGWTLGSEYLLAGMHGLIRIYLPAQTRMLAAYWKAHPPGTVVSLVPNFNRALFQGLRGADPDAPFVTILTDFADYPPHFWIERQPQYLICGTDKAVQQARQFGYTDQQIYRTSGMILRPAFFREFHHDRAAERLKLELDPNRRTGVVLFGGQGSARMLAITRMLEPLHDDVQLMLICGRNEKLAAELKALPGHLRKHIVGFTSDIPYYMSLADFFIGKPGPGSISEAIAMKLPVIIERNAWTLPQERYNADWVRDHEVGIVVRSFDQIATAVRELLAPGTLNLFRSHAAAIRNQAIFEIPAILKEIAVRHGR